MMKSTTKIKGSKSGRIITASFNGPAKQYFPTLNNTKALVLLSIKGNEFCTGEYLNATIKQAISTHAFTTFLIADEIYWHNLKDKRFTSNQEPALRENAKKLGIIYFEENLKYFLDPLHLNLNEFNKTHSNPIDKKNTINNIAQKSSNFEILFWQDWVNDEEYQSKKNMITNFYESIDILKNSISDTAQNYVSRQNSQTVQADLQNSKDYLIEESPAIVWIAAKRGYHFIAYAGEMIQSLKITKEFFVIDCQSAPPHPYCIQVQNPNKLLNWLQINFKRKHASNNTSQKKGTTEISEIAKGVAVAILSSSYDEKTKIELLVNFSSHFLKEITTLALENDPTIQTDNFNAFIEKLKNGSLIDT